MKNFILFSFALTLFSCGSGIAVDEGTNTDADTSAWVDTTGADSVYLEPVADDRREEIPMSLDTIVDRNGSNFQITYQLDRKEYSIEEENFANELTETIYYVYSIDFKIVDEESGEVVAEESLTTDSYVGMDFIDYAGEVGDTWESGDEELAPCEFEVDLRYGFSIRWFFIDDDYIRDGRMLYYSYSFSEGKGEKIVDYNCENCDV